MTLALAPSSTTTVGQQLFANIRKSSRPLWFSTVAMLGFCILCLGLGWFDDRLIQGVSVWSKPAKFFLSLAVQFATVAWAMGFLPAAEQRAKSINLVVVLMLVSGWLEMAYIVFRAARGEASHFNTGDATAALLYGLMGVFALFLTATAGYVGLRLWRHRRHGLWTEAAAIGLVSGSILGTLAGAYMSAQTGHWVGGAVTDANGLGFFAWSTSGGDLRVAHFVGLHAAQIIPLAALSGKRGVVYGATTTVALLTLATFAMAVSGLPLLRV